MLFFYSNFLFTAVLNGDLKLFNQVIDKFKEKFLSEKTYTLIIRLILCLFMTSLFTSMLFTENVNDIIINQDCLIIRLRHNVIKAGVRMINLSYSRISLTDIAQKLQLDSSEDAEFIVAKVASST